ncbi:MAG: CBS domain-containing protein [Cyclobacteriaceae bacterium]|nr:CBS domain-containing protein [Cyclobacteriaceae bacterium]
MGEQNVNSAIDNKARSVFIKSLLNDISALDIMLEKDLIESDITRIGAEQEFCLVTENWRPSKKAVEILNDINDSHFTTELALYNLEINLDPVEMSSNCFSHLEKQLNTLLSKARNASKKHNTNIILTGILPTISKNELQFDYMTPNPRYWELNNMIRKLRGTDFELHIRGVDELSLIHDSVLFEACNTSFQMHLQIAPKDFIASYNWAQAITGPILGVCTNSPLLLGRELWSETRIALFRQSIDIRNLSHSPKNQEARVNFSDAWATGTVADIFKNDIAMHKVILSREIESDALIELESGKLPKLHALNLHNGTVYRWNRPCYGSNGKKAHLRIENRYIPSGPTTVDEIANFAFWAGLMIGRPPQFDDMPNCMDFKDAKTNFIKTARSGKESVLMWNDTSLSVKDLVINELLPMAYSGLEKASINKSDIERLLGIIDARARGMTGSQWKTKNYRQLRKSMKQDDALLTLTKSIYNNQQSNIPVHKWPSIKKRSNPLETASQVGHIMTTQLFTVNENDLAELATRIMLWKNIHHLPVENNAGEFCGLLTWTHMKRQKELKGSNKIVADIMTKEVLTTEVRAKIKDIIQLMKKHEIGCLPVIRKKQLVGIVTINDLTKFDNGKSTQ